MIDVDKKTLQIRQSGLIRGIRPVIVKILKGNYSDIKLAFRSGLGDKNSIIFNYLIETINANKDISENFSNSSVLEFYEIVNFNWVTNK